MKAAKAPATRMSVLVLLKAIHEPSYRCIFGKAVDDGGRYLDTYLGA